MSDGVARGVLGETATAMVVVATHAAQEAQNRHGLSSTSALLLAQGLTMGALLAAWQKSGERINLQLECDGPLRGLFVDAAESGEIRGYVKERTLDLGGSPEALRLAIGKGGFFSVIRDLGGEYYRSTVELSLAGLGETLEGYFAQSDQRAARVGISCTLGADGRVGYAAGVLLLGLPGGKPEEFANYAAVIGREIPTTGASPAEVLRQFFPEAPLLEEGTLRFACDCSYERARRALAALGSQEVRDIIATQGRTAIDCNLCGAHHEFSREALEELLARLEGTPC